MGLTILARGAEAQRVRGTDAVGEQIVKEPSFSFMGILGNEVAAKVGIGVTFTSDNYTRFWGHLESYSTPHHLIETWRGWRLLEETWYIGNTTLCACLAGGNHVIADHCKAYVGRLWLQFGGHFMDRRHEILTSVPSSFDLELMTDILMQRGINFSAREIVREYEKLGVQVPPHILHASRNEPAETFWEKCMNIGYGLFR